MTNILIYTFWIPRGIIAQTLFGMKDDYKIIYTSGDRGLRTLESQILNLQPKYILGLGYYRSGVKKIRTEKVFRNIYGTRKISSTGKDMYFSNWELKHEMLTDGLNAGRSHCNKYGYKTLEILENAQHTDTKFAYLHVPPDFNKDMFKNILLEIVKTV